MAVELKTFSEKLFLKGMANSRYQGITVRGVEFMIKREDDLEPLSGNKARKLFALLEGNPTDVVSFGGAQSNAMLSLSAACKIMGKKLYYFTRFMPGNLRANPFGNLKTAFDNGMKLFQCIDNETAEQEARRYGMMSSLQSYIQRRNIKPYSFHKEAIARWQNEVLRCWRRNSTTTSPTSHIAILLYFFLEGRAQLPFIFGSIFLPQ
jgi:1-aminocyclopropane-1-carboxylate deaminase/D-cysteine desulfhydrase-like pyridoxal-dependent ACC family enzyme